MQELTPLPFHAQTLHPVTADDCTKTRVVADGIEGGFTVLLVTVVIGDGDSIFIEEYAAGLFVGEGILEFWDCLMLLFVVVVVVVCCCCCCCCVVCVGESV
jgi:hypothetical protein